MHLNKCERNKKCFCVNHDECSTGGTASFLGMCPEFKVEFENKPSSYVPGQYNNVPNSITELV